MKKLGLILLTLALVPVLQAQENANTISAPKNSTVSSESKPDANRPKPQQGQVKEPVSTVKGTGLVYEISEKGLVVISPTAPASYGYGTKALITNPGTPISQVSNQVNANERTVDGIALIGWSW
jgi:hypothetical protein